MKNGWIEVKSDSELPYDKLIIIADNYGSMCLALLKKEDDTLYTAAPNQECWGSIKYFSYVEELPNKNNNYEKYMSNLNSRKKVIKYMDWLKKQKNSSEI